MEKPKYSLHLFAGAGGGLSPTSSAERQCPCAQLKSSNTRKAYSQPDFPKCRYGMMSAPSGQTILNALECSQTFANTPMNLSLPAAFRAKIFLALERAREYAEKEAAYGQNMRVSFARFDLDSYSWKIPHFLFQEDWASFSQTWPRWGMMRHGVCYQLNQWEPDTNETESGLQLYGTATAQGGIRSERFREGRSPSPFKLAARDRQFPTPVAGTGNYNYKGASATSGDGLITAVKRAEKWPTPVAKDATSTSPNEKPRDKLVAAVEKGRTKNATYPTPNIDSMCGGSGSYAQIMQNPNLTDEEKRSMASGNAGQLNPDWEEWLMFWPVGWSDIETPNEELVWLHPAFDPADRERFRLPRLTTRRQHRAHRVKAIGNGQYPATAWAAFEWGFAVLSAMREAA